MLLSKCSVRVSKKSKFNKKQEACGLLSSLGIKTPLSKILCLYLVLFCFKSIKQVNTRYKMNEIVNAFLLTLFRMGFFEAAHGWGGPFCPHPSPSLKSTTHILQ